MRILDYKTNDKIGEAEIDEEAYAEFLENDNSGSGAVRAGDWLTGEQLNELNIDAELTIYADDY